MKKVAGWARTPIGQLVAAVCVMLAGGYLIALWVDGLLLVLGGLLWAAHAVLINVPDDDDEDLSSHQALLRRYQNSR